jgi:MFS family permease
MMNGLQSLSYWQNYFDNPRGSILGFFNASMSLGSIIGLPIIPPLLDRYGRKSGIVLGSLIVLIGVGMQAGALNFGMFVAARFLLGFGMVIATAAAPLLVAEISHPQDRAILCTFVGVSYGIGSFIASWVTFGTLKITSDWAWRLPSLLQGVCSIIVLCFIWFIPESPRWYISRDQPEKALQVLAYYHADGDEKEEFVQLEYIEIRTSFMLEKEAANSTKYVDFIKTPGNRKRIGLICALSLFSQWSGNGLVSYYLTIIMKSIGITNPEDQLGINAGLQSWGLVVAVVFSFLIDTLGRRPMYLTGTIGTLITFVIWTILSARYAIHEDAGLGKGVVVMIFCYQFFYNLK